MRRGLRRVPGEWEALLMSMKSMEPPWLMLVVRQGPVERGLPEPGEWSEGESDQSRPMTR